MQENASKENKENKNKENKNKETTLKLNTSIEEINKISANTKYSKAWYKEEITEKNKTLKFSKNALEILQNEGINIDKTYISHNREQALYTVIKFIFDNSECFSKRVSE